MMTKKKDPLDKHLSYEEAYYQGLQREDKEERKRAQAKDRSKYKKTDRQKSRRKEEREREELDPSLLHGLVLSIHSEGIVVQHEQRSFYCTLRGTLKQEQRRERNLLSVGDWVRFSAIDEKEGVIEYVEPRQSVLARGDPLHQQRRHIIAANVEQVLITVSVVNPLLRTSIIDRYIIAARKGNMLPVIIVNKIDLLEDATLAEELRSAQKSLLDECIRAYSYAEIPLLFMSAMTGEGLTALRDVMDQRLSVFSGQSGVGKTHLINALTGRSLPVRETVEATKKGAHTTTRAKILSLPTGGWCVDTPGIKSFGVWDLQPEEVEDYFSEIHALGQSCHFADCTHTHEEDCAVKQALEKGELSPLRYDSYVSLIESARQPHLRR